MKGKARAKILSNGHIKCGDITGSIHAVAKSLMNGAPVNGWDAWFYKDENGNKIVIDELRREDTGSQAQTSQPANLKPVNKEINMNITLTINANKHEVDCAPSETLLSAVRRLGLLRSQIWR